MGYLMREGLKTLCGVNQWCYAVFWKFCHQNPKLLLWEECCHGPGMLISGNGNLGFDFQSSLLNKARCLVDEMMINNHVNVLGQGLVGQVALTGNHQWMLSENHYREDYPLEVLKDVGRQFSAGIQTIAVIPVLPHGVIQFGSYLRIPEDVRFVNDVVSLVTQLVHKPSVLQTQHYVEKELVPTDLPVFPGHSTLYESNMMNASSSAADSFSCGGCLAQTSVCNGQPTYALPRGIQNDLQSSVEAFQALNSSLCCLTSDKYCEDAQVADPMKTHFCLPNLFMNSMDKMETNILLDTGLKNSLLNACSGDEEYKTDAYDIPTAQHDKHSITSVFAPVEDYGKHKTKGLNLLVNDANLNNSGVQPQSGNNLFNSLGADFKNGLSGQYGSCRLTDQPVMTEQCWRKNDPLSKTSLLSSSSGIFSSTSTDYLLDAVVSSIRPSVDKSLDDNVSCRTTLTNISSSSTFGASLPQDQSNRELVGIPKYLASAGSAISTGKSPSKENRGAYSQSSSVYNSWIGSGNKTNRNNSVSTGYSRKPHDTNKVNRKRLKPGENPRPRPKDRQMIQDRLKELRELVPNGAKCSIDALLEGTIKHMLFLQSVTKHAKKLKHSAEAKVISDEKDLPVKENFEGGATWAYEVGSQSMVCPIIVKDLNQPRQMLVEMLFEERGLFLEISDIIRGMGLTILKGIMETQDNKIRAHFTIEANRDISRMEIFLSLVRLLDQNTEGHTTQPSNIGDDHPSVQQFHLAPAVLATGKSYNLQ